jgi:hypothetical protein
MTPRFFFLPNIGLLIALAGLFDPRGGRVRRAAAATLLAALMAATGLNNYILIYKWRRDKTKYVARMTEIADSVAAQMQRAPDDAVIYVCLPGLDVALDSAIKLQHPAFLGKYYFLNCQGPTQTVASRSLYQANRRRLKFPATFARNPCTYDDLVYGVVDASPRAVLDQFRGGAAALVVDLDRDGHMTLLDREQVVRMLAIRYGIQLDEPKPPA